MRKLIAVLILVPMLISTLVVPAFGISQAKASVLLEMETGRVLYDNNSHEPMGMASTTKIMTALIALEQPNIDTPFEVDAEAIKVEGSSMGLVPGDIVTLRTLAWGMLMHSGNDAAGAAAVAIAGDQAAFADMMNQRAALIGMKDSHFTNPSGLSDPEHYASAYDMALLAAEALKNPAFREMTSSKTVSVEYGNPPYKRLLLNHNRLLWRYPYTIGVKTGFTKAAGRCLVSAAEKDGVTLICVTLNCYDDFASHQEAFEEYFALFTRVDFSGELSELMIPVVGSAAGVAVKIGTSLAQPITAPLMEGEEAGCRVVIEAPRFLYAPVAAGEAIGRVVVYFEGRAIAESELLAAGTVVAAEVSPTMWERLFGK